MSEGEDKDEGFIDAERRGKIRDSEAMEIIKRIAAAKDCPDLIEAAKEKRDRIITLLKAEGLTIRQISRLTGINRGIIQRASD
jgi:hypothetical protein